MAKKKKSKEKLIKIKDIQTSETFKVSDVLNKNKFLTCAVFEKHKMCD